MKLVHNKELRVHVSPTFFSSNPHRFVQLPHVLSGVSHTFITCAELITQISNYGVPPYLILAKKQVMKQYVSGSISRRRKAAAVSHCTSCVTVNL